MSKKRSGVTLVVVMVLIIMISLGVYSFAQLMTAQESGTVMAGRRIQAQAAVAAGVEYLKDYLTLLPEDRAAVGGHWDNPSYFQDIVVGSEEQGGTRFSIISISEDDFGEPTEIRFGLVDEGSKLNINFLSSDTYGGAASGGGGGTDAASGDATGGDDDEDSESEEAEDPAELARLALMALPGMTEDIADAILDWIDEDDIPRDYGAEASAYAALGYEPRNGPIANLDELLLVQGVTNDLLYGADRNHNGLLEPYEQSNAGIGDGSASMARGWSAYLTTRSLDIVEQAETTIDLNQDDLEALYDELIAADFDPDFASYVVVYRQSGPYQEQVPDDAPEDYEAPVPQSITGREPDFSKNGETEIGSVLDLLGTSSQGQFPVPNKEEPEQVLVQSPYMSNTQLAAILPEMMSQLSTGGELGGTRGVNTNHCPSSVMGGLPNIDPSVVQNMMQLQDRGGVSGDPNYLFPTWPLGLGAVSIEEMKALLPFVAGQGTVFRAQVLGYSDVPGVFARAEVVIDASGDVPRVVSWRDLSHLGLAFSIDTLTQ